MSFDPTKVDPLDDQILDVMEFAMDLRLFARANLQQRPLPQKVVNKIYSQIAKVEAIRVRIEQNRTTEAALALYVTDPHTAFSGMKFSEFHWVFDRLLARKRGQSFPLTPASSAEDLSGQEMSVKIRSTDPGLQLDDMSFAAYQRHLTELVACPELYAVHYMDWDEKEDGWQRGEDEEGEEPYWGPEEDEEEEPYWGPEEDDEEEPCWEPEEDEEEPDWGPEEMDGEGDSGSEKE